MKNSYFIIILLLQVYCGACSRNAYVSNPTNQNAELISTQNNKPDIPEGWKKVEECGLSFHMPSDLKEIKVQPFDSCVKKYQSKNIIVSIDLVENAGDELSSRSGEYSDKKDFQIATSTVDGQKAESIKYYLSNNGGFRDRQDLFYGAVLYVPRIDKNNDNLTIWSYSRTAEDRQTTIKIFETVRFEK